jgi:hypothetical protein
LVDTATGSFTPGCIGQRETGKVLLNQAEIDAAYRVDDGHFTRSYAHQVFKGGPLAQEALDNGEQLFSGNAGTDFGTLVDRAIPMVVAGVALEEHLAVVPDEVLSNGARRGKAYTDWVADNADKSIITAPDMWRLRRILQNVARHRDASAILEATTDMQVTFRHVDAAGHKRKALADGMTPGFLWDFKTTSSDWKQLWRSCVDYGYLWQAAWYVDAAMACGWDHHSLKFVFAQTFKPHAVRVYTLPEELVEEAREQIKVTLDQIRLRRELGVYRAPEDDEELELEFPAFLRGGRDGY